MNHLKAVIRQGRGPETHHILALEQPMGGYCFRCQLGASHLPKGNGSVPLSVSWTIYSTNTSCFYLHFSSSVFFLCKPPTFVCDQHKRKIERKMSVNKQAGSFSILTFRVQVIPAFWSSKFFDSCSANQNVFPLDKV